MVLRGDKGLSGLVLALLKVSNSKKPRGQAPAQSV